MGSLSGRNGQSGLISLIGLNGLSGLVGSGWRKLLFFLLDEFAGDGEVGFEILSEGEDVSRAWRGRPLRGRGRRWRPRWRGVVPVRCAGFLSTLRGGGTWLRRASSRGIWRRRCHTDAPAGDCHSSSRPGRGIGGTTHAGGTYPRGGPVRRSRQRAASIPAIWCWFAFSAAMRAADGSSKIRRP